MDEIEYPQSMTYKERESLKVFAGKGQCLAEALTMIAHWMRQSQEVTFTGFAANWCEANRLRLIDPMREHWPHTGTRFIADNTSEWGSALPEA